MSAVATKSRTKPLQETFSNAVAPFVVNGNPMRLSFGTKAIRMVAPTKNAMEVACRRLQESTELYHKIYFTHDGLRTVIATPLDNEASAMFKELNAMLDGDTQ